MEIETITICGGGNAAHALIPILKNNFQGKINLFLPYKNEADCFIRLIREKKSIIAIKGEKKLYGRPDKISRFAKEVCPDADLILLLLPAFAHESTLCQIASFLKEEAIVGAIPARSGFEYATLKILKDYRQEKVKIFGLQTLPWACRIREYASKVEILGEKRSVGLAAFPHKITFKLANILTRLFNLKIEPLPNMLTLSLANIGQILHPGIMYGLFKGNEGRRYRKEEIPLFYHGVTKETAQILEEMSNEILILTKEIQKKNKYIDLSNVFHVEDWLINSYRDSIQDKRSLQSCLVTNEAYRGIYAPMREIGEGYFLPDFQSRYLTEDVPYGLVVTKAIAQLAEVKTFIIDEVILMTSKWMGREYLVNRYLKGKDVKESRIPQNYGINCIEEIMSY